MKAAETFSVFPHIFTVFLIFFNNQFNFFVNGFHKTITAMSKGILSGEGHTVEETSAQVHGKWLYMFILLAVRSFV